MSQAQSSCPSAPLRCPPDLKHGFGAGIAWGMVMGLGLSVLAFFDCGTICLSDVIATTGLSVVAGIFTMGPFVAFYPRSIAQS